MDSNPSLIQVLISLGGMLGSGISAYIGVRVALTKIETRQDNHDKDIARLDNRMTYIERHLFIRRNNDDE